MSRVDKLSIRGIRSFSPHETNVIEFYSPLTLIVGHNGSGKTTVIECLKYATTGDMPPGSKGGAFIYDPKLANEAEVKAQIKLKFHNKVGREMICVRSLQLTMKRTKMEQKTLEGMLITRDPETNEQISVSTKCAQLDDDMPNLLGTNRAILENVIFCHQEDSNWPLSEPAVLKKKFDEIFSATKYTKALDSIKSLRKEQSVQIKLDAQELSHLQVEREKSERVKRSLLLVEENMDEYKRSIVEIMQSMEQDKADITDYESQTNRYQALKNQFDIGEQEQQMLERQANEMIAADGFVQLSESDEALQLNLKEIQSILLGSEQHFADKEAQRSNLSTELTQVRAALTEKAVIKGQYQAEKEANELRRKKIAQYAEELSSKTDIAIHGTELSHMNTFLTAFGQYCSRIEGGLLSSEKTYDSNMDKLTRQLNAINAEIRFQEELRASKIRDKKNNMDRSASIMQQLSKTENIQREVESLKQLVDQESKVLESEREKSKSTDKNGNLKRQETERTRIENRLATLNDEIASMNVFMEKRAKLSLINQDAESKQQKIRSMRTQLVDDIRTLDPAVTDDTVCDITTKLLTAKNGAVKHLESLNELAKQKLDSARTRIAMHCEELKKKEEAIDEFESMFYQKYGHGSTYESVLASLEADIRAQECLLVSDDEKTFLKKLLQKSLDCKTCPLCERGFHSDTEYNSFVAQITAKVDSSASNVFLEDKIRKYQIEKTDLLALHSEWAKISQFKSNDISHLQSVLAAERLHEREAENERMEHDMHLSQAKLELDQLNRLTARVQELMRVIGEAAYLESSCNELKGELDSVGSVREIEDIQRDMDECQLQLKNNRRTIERLNSEIRHGQLTLESRERAYRESKEKLLYAESQLSERTRLLDEYQTLLNSNQKIDSLVEEITTKQKSLEDDRKALENKIAGEQNKFRTEKEQKYSQLLDLKQQHSRLHNIIGEFVSHENALTSQSVRGIEKEISDLEARQRKLQQEVTSISDELSQHSSHLSNLRMKERGIQENIRYRKTKTALSGISEKLKSMRDSMGQFNIDRIRRQSSDLQRRYSVSANHLASKQGEVKQLENQRDSLRRELNTDYRDIGDKYRQQLIKLKTTELACADLEKYAKALDSAIMKYHSMKMEEINKIINELWVNTYRGNDIETIEIRSDAETAKGNRSYNYRVVMIKGDTEVDMRGRCSAGQKVLASLIIRLALAETFCINCGILALDEPTTNLDRDNIESLGDSLNKIIESRRRQRNFQLVVITHDEDFLKYLGKSEFADYYFRIQKDENQYSQIERRAITTV